MESGRLQVLNIIGWENGGYAEGREWHTLQRVEWVDVGDADASKLLRRPYRAPWVHPEPDKV